VLRHRADIVRTVRDFFRERGVVEVETPLLCHAGVVDEHLDPIPALVRLGATPSTLWLVTSPEHSMKRLVAAGSGPIYQITRGFRDGERGRRHNPEFSILEWYRPSWDHHRLMEEVEDLVRQVVTRHAAKAVREGLIAGVSGPFERLSYREAFFRSAGVDPFSASPQELARAAREAGAARRDEDTDVDPTAESDRDELLNTLLVSRVEATLGQRAPTFVVDYPPSQAALARVRLDQPSVAERFELYFRGVELCNGYHELTDAEEQERRFVEANRRREVAGKPALPIDGRLLEALRSGMPECAGVALGLDRLFMVTLGLESIDEVLAFPIERA
jgi:lysyl-tRNA synthetase class 2